MIVPVFAQEIWKMEKEVMEAVQQADVAKYHSFFSVDFIGWPTIYDSPVDYFGIIEWVKKIKNESYRLCYSLEFMNANRVSPNNVNIFYRLNIEYTNLAGETWGGGQYLKVFHSWYFSDSWKIICGMSSRTTSA